MQSKSKRSSLGISTQNSSYIFRFQFGAVKTIEIPQKIEEKQVQNLDDALFERGKTSTHKSEGKNCTSTYLHNLHKVLFRTSDTKQLFLILGALFDNFDQLTLSHLILY